MPCTHAGSICFCFIIFYSQRPQAVMATGQVLFHRFLCKEVICPFQCQGCANICRKLRLVLVLVPLVLGTYRFLSVSIEFAELKIELSKQNREAYIEGNGFFVVILRTTLCVRFKSAVVACGVVYAAARRFQVPLPESPPWWKAFDAEKSGIDEVCRVLAHLYSLPKAQYEIPRTSSLLANNDSTEPKAAPSGVNVESGGSKDITKVALDKLKESKKTDDESKPAEGEAREELVPRSKSEHRTEASGDKSKERDRDRERERERDRIKAQDRDRGRDSDRERERDEIERDRDRAKDRGRHRSKDRGRESGHSEKSRHHSSRDRDYHSSSYSSREKDRHRHHSYA
ncbi:hypothetical protein POTOM_061706 [Populus tomentosa]|uniref:Uncharacterized protein n=1 Tax=Populus tomentosa TaxID=118781 RepID=A0A8X8C016_POPTO|nr:hypothetical protein POTOM_061706 [Populus tomentosa]